MSNCVLAKCSIMQKVQLTLWSVMTSIVPKDLNLAACLEDRAVETY